MVAAWAILERVWSKLVSVAFADAIDVWCVWPVAVALGWSELKLCLLSELGVICCA